MARLPSNGRFQNVGSIMISNTKTQVTVFAWGDFAGGALKIEGIVPHEDGDEVFGPEDEIKAEQQEELDTLEPDEAPEPLRAWELRERGFLNLVIRTPNIRLSLIDCDDTPDVKYYIC